MLFQLPRASRLFTVLQPANQWGWSEALINKSNYLLEILAWQNANQGVKKSKQTAKPELFIPEFMRGSIGKETDIEKHTTDEIRDILSMPRA